MVLPLRFVNITTRDIYPYVSHTKADQIHLSGSLNPEINLSVKIYSKPWKKIITVETKTIAIKKTWTKSNPYHKVILSVAIKCNRNEINKNIPNTVSYLYIYVTYSYVNQKNQLKIIFSDFEFIKFYNWHEIFFSENTMKYFLNMWYIQIFLLLLHFLNYFHFCPAMDLFLIS